MNKNRKIILLVLNDHETRVALRLAYEKMGIEVISRASATDALSFLRSGKMPDLIITGGPFPGLSVSQLVKRLKATEEYRNIPIGLIKGPKGMLPGTSFAIDLNDPQSVKEALSHFLADR